MALHGRASKAPKARSTGSSRSRAHPGFKGAQRQIASQPARGGGRLGMRRAGAILAAGARKASAAAKRRNPRLKQVKGA